VAYTFWIQELVNLGAESWEQTRELLHLLFFRAISDSIADIYPGLVDRKKAIFKLDEETLCQPPEMSDMLLPGRGRVDPLYHLRDYGVESRPCEEDKCENPEFLTVESCVPGHKQHIVPPLSWREVRS
jgi:hypothetical protein